MATVGDVSSGFGWRISLSRNPLLSTLRACLPATSPVNPLSGIDIFSWCTKEDYKPLSDETQGFSTKKTWRKLQPQRESVAWAKFVWFSHRIPKHSFITWIAIQNRLPTRDRLQCWGINVPLDCLLCGASIETKDHIFFDCSFSKELWDIFFSSSVFSAPAHLIPLFNRIDTLSANKDIKLITLLLAQAIIYIIWKERNSRYHNSTTRSATSLANDINQTMRAKLLGLMNIYRTISTSLLTLWFQHYDTTLQRSLV